jgi:hypothetical protein
MKPKNEGGEHKIITLYIPAWQVEMIDNMANMNRSEYIRNMLSSQLLETTLDENRLSELNAEKLSLEDKIADASERLSQIDDEIKQVTSKIKDKEDLKKVDRVAGLAKRHKYVNNLPLEEAIERIVQDVELDRSEVEPIVVKEYGS